MINYEFAILIGVFAFVYSNLLTEPDALLNKLYNRLDIFFKNDVRQMEGKGRHPLFMILIHCEKCIAGQIALWGFGYDNYIWYYFEPLKAAGTHLIFVAFAILTAAILRGLYHKHIKT